MATKVKKWFSKPYGWHDMKLNSRKWSDTYHLNGIIRMHDLTVPILCQLNQNFNIL